MSNRVSTRKRQEEKANRKAEGECGMKRVVKSVMANLFCGILILGICGCGGGAQQSTDVQASEESAVGTSASAEKTVRISVAAASNIDMPELISCTDGSSLEILKYPDGMLGSDYDIVQGCQAGTVSVYIGNATMSTDAVPELSLLSIPYLIDDFDTYQDTLQNTWKDWFQPYYHKSGLQLLAWSSDYDGYLVSSVPIHTLEDLQDVNLRIIKNRYRERYWSGLVRNVFSLTYDEIGYYLQTGQINASEVGLKAMLHFGDMNYFHYLVPVGHIPAINSVVMNQEEYEALTAEQQELLTEYAQAAITSGEDVVQTCMDEYNLEISEPDEELKTLLRSGKAGIIEDLRRSLGTELVEDFLSTTAP